MGKDLPTLDQIGSSEAALPQPLVPTQEGPEQVAASGGRVTACRWYNGDS
jgi:hypothetical protein